MTVLVHEEVSSSSSDEVLVHEEGRRERDDKASQDAPPEQCVGDASLHGPRDEAMNALSMASIVAMEAVSEARAMGTTPESLRPRSLPGNAPSGDPT